MKNVLVLLLTLVYLASCSPEVDFVEPFTSDEVTENENNPEEGETDEESQEELSTDPCDFSLENAEIGETIIIDCIMDLGGKTISLPSDVTLEYDGGDILNGTLNFNNGKIDGKLLNQTLEIKGTANLLDAIFEFIPKRWDIVEGTIDSDRALKNTIGLESLMEFVKGLGATTFEMGAFDAYFEISKVTSTTSNQNFYPTVEAINVPSDFNLQMSDNTHLRILPNGRALGSLIGFRDAENITISGGVLHGDRDEHFYGDDPPEEGQNLIKIESGRNIIIDGVKIVDGSKGGMNINSLGFTFNSDYKPSHNIVVKNCVFENNRRMGMSITDGFDIIIENNKFINSGQPSSYVDGGVVGYALNIEGVRTRDQNTGQLVYYERPHNIIVRGNYERGSRVGGITISSGDNVLVENNDMENKIVYSATSDSEIRNNKLISSSKSSESPAIIAGGRGESVFNNEISGNVIEGYGVGIVAYYDDVRVLNNIINECGTGIQLKEITNSTISNNKINSTVSISRGIMAHLTSANNVSVSNNEINVVVDAFYLVELNRGSGQDNFKLNVSENIINSTNGKITFSNINGLNFESNVIGSGIQMVNVSRIDLQSNKVVNTKGNGISLRESNVNVVIAGNDILIPLNYECIKNTSTSQTGVNIDTSNICTNN